MFVDSGVHFQFVFSFFAGCERDFRIVIHNRSSLLESSQLCCEGMFWYATHHTTDYYSMIFDKDGKRKNKMVWFGRLELGWVVVFDVFLFTYSSCNIVRYLCL